MPNHNQTTRTKKDKKKKVVLGASLKKHVRGQSPDAPLLSIRKKKLENPSARATQASPSGRQAIRSPDPKNASKRSKTPEISRKATITDRKRAVSAPPHVEENKDAEKPKVAEDKKTVKDHPKETTPAATPKTTPEGTPKATPAATLKTTPEPAPKADEKETKKNVDDGAHGKKPAAPVLTAEEQKLADKLAKDQANKESLERVQDKYKKKHFTDPIIPKELSLLHTELEPTSSDGDPVHVSTVMAGPFTLKSGLQIEILGNKEYKVGNQFFKVTDKLGQGTTTVVLQLSNKNENSEKKKLAMKHTSHEGAHYWLTREYHILKRLTSIFGHMLIDEEIVDYFDKRIQLFLYKHVVRVFGYRYPDDATKEMSLFLEPLQCTLEEYFTTHKRNTPHLHIIRSVLDKIIRTVQYVREHGVIHPQINSANFMIPVERPNKACIEAVKLINFDHAIVMNDPTFDPRRDPYIYKASIDDYSAPELIFGEPPHSSFEMYSVGLIALRLLVGENVMKGHDDYHHDVTKRGNLSCQLGKMMAFLGDDVPSDYLNSDVGRRYFVKDDNGRVQLKTKCERCTAGQDSRQLKTRKDLKNIKPNFLPDPELCIEDEIKEYAKERAECEKEDLKLLIKFIKGCLQWDPSARSVTLQTALQSPFFILDQLPNHGGYRCAAKSLLDTDKYGRRFNDVMTSGRAFFYGEKQPKVNEYDITEEESVRCEKKKEKKKE